MTNDAKERLNDLQDYLKLIEARIAAPTPEKHLEHPQTYKAYLEGELSLVKAKIEKLRIE